MNQPHKPTVRCDQCKVWFHCACVGDEEDYNIGTWFCKINLVKVSDFPHHSCHSFIHAHSITNIMQCTVSYYCIKSILDLYKYIVELVVARMLINEIQPMA